MENTSQETKKIIQIKGLNKHAKERIRQHGRGDNKNSFTLESKDGNRILVRSLEPSWKLKANMWDFWMGWFDMGTDVVEI